MAFYYFFIFAVWKYVDYKSKKIEKRICIQKRPDQSLEFHKNSIPSEYRVNKKKLSEKKMKMRVNELRPIYEIRCRIHIILDRVIFISPKTQHNSPCIKFWHFCFALFCNVFLFTNHRENMFKKPEIHEN